MSVSEVWFVSPAKGASPVSGAIRRFVAAGGAPSAMVQVVVAEPTPALPARSRTPAASTVNA